MAFGSEAESVRRQKPYCVLPIVKWLLRHNPDMCFLLDSGRKSTKHRRMVVQYCNKFNMRVYQPKLGPAPGSNCSYLLTFAAADEVFGNGVMVQATLSLSTFAAVERRYPFRPLAP